MNILLYVLEKRHCSWCLVLFSPGEEKGTAGHSHLSQLAWEGGKLRRHWRLCYPSCDMTHYCMNTETLSLFRKHTQTCFSRTKACVSKPVRLRTYISTGRRGGMPINPPTCWIIFSNTSQYPWSTPETQRTVTLSQRQMALLLLLKYEDNAACWHVQQTYGDVLSFFPKTTTCFRCW